jgi:hypothetical protein
MSQLLRCKACGFLTTEEKLGAVCPACGVPRSAFEPYADPLSARRRKILELNLHPIAIHFPQAFAVSILALTISPFVFSGSLETLFLSAAKVLSLILPAVVILSFLTGFVDGKNRFKKVRRSVILKKKIILAVLFFLFSLALALLMWIGGVSSQGLVLVSIALAVGAFVCSFFLGNLGSRIMTSILPGD